MIMIEVQACAAADTLQELITRYPYLRSQLFTEQKEVNDAIHLFVNNEHIRFAADRLRRCKTATKCKSS